MSQNIKYKSAEEIKSYVDTNSEYIDFTHFEGNSEQREQEITKFIQGQEYVPSFDYPKLDKLYDDTSEKDDSDDDLPFAEKKRETWESILELEANKQSGILSLEEFDLTAGFHEYRLKRMLLVEAARSMRYADDSADQVTARNEFMNLNKELYGEVNNDLFVGIMNSEAKRVIDFHPKDEDSQAIKEYLSQYFNDKSFVRKEAPILPVDTLKELSKIVSIRYADMLSAIPNTDESVIYNATECQKIIQAALDACDLGEKGWQAEIDPKKSFTDTNGDKKKILLPSNTSRTADELRRLIIHEAGVHARRSQNGSETGYRILERGTANYGDIEEGLGILLECAVAGNLDNESFDRARDRYIAAGLALGTDGVPKDARATFEILWRLIALKKSDGHIDNDLQLKAKRQVADHIINAFRGTNFAMPGIIYSKLKVYYEGFVKNAAFIESNKNDINHALDIAMLCKYDHTDEDEVRKVTSLIKNKQTSIST